MSADARPVDGPPGDEDLAATTWFDHDVPAVRAWVAEVVGEAATPEERARRLFAAVRDRVRYSPYAVDVSPATFTTSGVLGAEASWCVPKASLLVGTARAAGIPARIGFADVRNHLSSETLRASMGTDVFVFHGYASLWVGGTWRKVSPAFNAELCARFGVPALEFDGRGDALLHAYDGQGRRHMEYLRDRGTWTGVPLEAMFAEFREVYGWDMAAAARAGGAGDEAFSA